jgi:hypothetical protein
MSIAKFSWVILSVAMVACGGAVEAPEETITVRFPVAQSDAGCQRLVEIVRDMGGNQGTCSLALPKFEAVCPGLRACPAEFNEELPPIWQAGDPAHIEVP